MSRIQDAFRTVDSKRGARKVADGGDFESEVESAKMASETAAIPLIEIPISDNERAGGRLLRTARATWSPDPKVMLQFSAAESVCGTEEFRALRSKLYQLREQRSLKRILIASALPREGRSFIAANLAQVMACQQDCNTLLIDADLRKPTLHAVLGTSASPGLAQYLLGEAEDFQVVQRGPIDNLFFIPAGRPVSGQSELLCGSRLKSLLDEAACVFDWIIVDSPSAMSISDSGVIANYCDGALLVVRSKSTPFDVVQKAREKLRPERMVGVVLNDIRVGPSTEPGPHASKLTDTDRDWTLKQSLSSEAAGSES